MAGPSTLFVVLVGYTAFTLAMMAQFGRDEWRSQGETFTVWFRLLGRLAPFALRRRGRPGPPALVRAAASWSPAGRCGRRDAGRARRGLDPVRRAVADADLLRPVRRSGAARQDGPAVRASSAHRRRSRRARGGPDGRASAATGAGLLPIARRLPHRPLPDLPADRRPADPHRRSPIRSRRAGTCSGPPSTSRAATSCRRASSGRSSSPRSSAGTCWARGAATSVAAADAPAGDRRPRPCGCRQIPLAVVMVGADDADPLVARPGDRGDDGRGAGSSVRR